MNTAARTFFISLLALAGLLAGCATISQGRMNIENALPEEVWIAPKIPESSQRQLVVPISLDLEAGLKLNGYRLTIYDGSGMATRIIEVAAEPPKRGLFGWNQQTVSVPEQIVWDGKDEAGTFVADGLYTYEIEVWDGLGNTGKLGSRLVHVDNTYPNVELSASILGPRILMIRHEHPTAAPRWTGSILNAAGEQVRSFSWDERPEDVVWEGTDDKGNVLPDGAYFYRIGAVNRAGTPRTIRLADPLIIDTRPKDVALRLQYAAFSPTGNSPRKTLALMPILKAPERIDVWTLVIYDAGNRAVRTYRGTAGAPQTIVFDGKASGGRYLPEGSYRGALDVAYINGETHKAISPPFSIINSGPVAALRMQNMVFAPGMGKKQSLVVHFESRGEARWSGTIFDGNWKPVLTVAWDRLPAAWKWDGCDEAGMRLADGSYRFFLTGIDAAENTRSYEVSGIRIDTRCADALLGTSDEVFSPNGDEVKDTIAFILGTERPDSVAVWHLRIRDSLGAVRRHFTGMGPWATNTAIWQGRDDNRTRLPDGDYSAALALEYENGLIAVSDPVRVLLDSTAPRLSVSVSPPLFSPDGDGENDSLTIDVEYRDKTPAESYSFKILDPARRLSVEFAGAGFLPTPLIWDGRFASGELVQSAADYPYSLQVRDAAGNLAVANGRIPTDILVIREGDKLRIDVPYIHFTPWSAELISREQNPFLYAQTQQAFELLIPKLQKFPEYAISIEGHAVRIYWWDEYRLGLAEERGVLAPLSFARAETVRRELVARGVAVERLLVDGLGGTEPLVPHSDLAGRWRNRRVEFILLKG